MKALILGGTGTLGQEITRQLLERRSRSEITVYCRDELKQKQMKQAFDSDRRLSFILGDIRDRDALHQAMRGFETVFHVAALKHVDWLEDFPEESVKTNILGTIHAADAAIEAGVKHFVFSSTDKAVDPINCYGACKMVSEKILLRRNETQDTTRFSIFRWGNVLGSRGSVIPDFVKAIRQGDSVPLTHPEMTRFWIRIEDAVAFLLKEYATAPKDRVMVPSIGCAPVRQVIDTLASLLGKSVKTKVVGLRRGEKMHEVLSSLHTDLPVFRSDGKENTLSQESLSKLLKPFVEAE